MSRRQLLDSRENRTCARHHAICEVVLNGAGLDGPVDAGVSEQCLNFGPENELFGVAINVERFDADAISCQKQSLSRPIPQSEGEHAAQVLDQPLAMFFIEMDEQ